MSVFVCERLRGREIAHVFGTERYLAGHVYMGVRRQLQELAAYSPRDNGAINERAEEPERARTRAPPESARRKPRRPRSRRGHRATLISPRLCRLLIPLISVVRPCNNITAVVRSED